MSIDKAAKATRRYCVEHHREWSGKTNNGLNFGILIGLGWRWLATSGEAQAACDRLNLLAVLEAIREPSDGMIEAERRTGGWVINDGDIWRVMIDAAIKEVEAK